MSLSFRRFISAPFANEIEMNAEMELKELGFFGYNLLRLLIENGADIWISTLGLILFKFEILHIQFHKLLLAMNIITEVYMKLY